MARRLEQGMGLQSGWLDFDHTQQGATILNEHEVEHQSLNLSTEAKIRLIQKLAASLSDQRSE
jgi:hypothetical protein